jgi:hypothetical protein
MLDIANAAQPGGFVWLAWNGDGGEPALVRSLTPPGNSGRYINPDDPGDRELSVGDWVRGRPAVANSARIRQALDQLKAQDIDVPVWDEARNSGTNALYRVVGFARVRLVDYRLPQENRISALFLGYAACGDSGAQEAGGMAGTAPADQPSILWSSPVDQLLSAIETLGGWIDTLGRILRRSDG